MTIQKIYTIFRNFGTRRVVVVVVVVVVEGGLAVPCLSFCTSTVTSPVLTDGGREAGACCGSFRQVY
jgi:hypothetical protein